MTRYPKLDAIIEEVVKKGAIDEYGELSRLQNFFSDTRGLLVTSRRSVKKNLMLTSPVLSYNKP